MVTEENEGDWYREEETDALRGIYGAIWGNT